MANFTGDNNTFITPDIVAREGLMILENQITSTRVMSTSAASEYSGAKVGDTIRVRRPAFFGIDEYTRGGGSVKIQDAVENSVNLVIEKQFDVSFEVSSKELALSVDEFSARLLRPAMSALAQKVDQYALSKIANLGGLANTSDFTAPNSLADVAAVVEKMNIQQIPMSGRKMLVSPVMQSQLYNIDAFARMDYKGGSAVSPTVEAELGRFMGLDVIMSQALPSHTVGSFLQGDPADVSFTTSAAYKEGTTTIALANGQGTNTDTINAGDTLRITYADGVARDHAVTANVANANGTIASISFTPGLYGVLASAASGSTPDVVASGAAVVVAGGSSTVTGYTLGAAFHPEAFQMIFVPQPDPMGPGTSSATMSYNGMSLRVMQSYDHLNKRDLISVDCLVGVAAVDGRLGVRVPSVNG